MTEVEKLRERIKELTEVANVLNQCCIEHDQYDLLMYDVEYNKAIELLEIGDL